MVISHLTETVKNKDNLNAAQKSFILVVVFAIYIYIERLGKIPELPNHKQHKY